MKRELLGYAKLGGKWIHRPQLTELEGWVLDTIAVYNQRLDGAPAPMAMVAAYVELSERDVRKMVNHLIQQHHLPIYPLPGMGGGYFMGDPDKVDAIQRAVQTHLRRVITGGRKARALGASAAELGQSMVQLALDLPGAEPQEVAEEISGLLADAGLPMSHAAVAHTLARYQGDPQRYADEIKDLAEQYGGLFIRRDDLQRVLADNLQQASEKMMVALLGGAQV